jgi:hypothetical protein
MSALFNFGFSQMREPEIFIIVNLEFIIKCMVETRGKYYKN